MRTTRRWRPAGLFLAGIVLGLVACSDAATEAGARPEDGDGGGADPPTEAGARCGEPAPPHGSALSIGGAQGVELGEITLTDRFTIEVWARRDAESPHLGTRGYAPIPIVGLDACADGDDAGVADAGASSPCGVTLGLYGDVVTFAVERRGGGRRWTAAALGKTTIAYGDWHHLAASYDGTTVRLYVDGSLDAEAPAPSFAGLARMTLGETADAATRLPRFRGAIDELRVDGAARSEAEIATSMARGTAPFIAPLAHLPIDAADGAILDRARGASIALPADATFVDAGVALDAGTWPRVRTATAEARTLTIEASDADGQPLEVEVFARALDDADDFSIAVLPDTQYYTRDAAPTATPPRPDADDPDYFAAQTRWTMAHRASKKIVGLLHVGDIVNSAGVPAQWARANAAMSLLEAPSPDAPDGLPYAVAFGNHDLLPYGEPDATTEVASEHFGRARFEGRAYYGGSYDDTNDHSWVSFWSGGLRVIVVAMKYDVSPSPEELAWARDVFASHPDALGLFTTHYVLQGDGDFGAQGQLVYDALKGVPNLKLMASGHYPIAARRTDVYKGNVVHSILQDYQGTLPDPADPSRPLAVDPRTTNGGAGYMRLWTFSPRKRSLAVETFSPKREGARYTTDADQFELSLDLVGAGGAFRSLGVTPMDGGRAVVTVPDDVGASVEWYAVVRDCSHAVKTRIQRLPR